LIRAAKIFLFKMGHKRNLAGILKNKTEAKVKRTA